MPLHSTPLHCFTLNFVRLQYIAPDCAMLHTAELYITLQCSSARHSTNIQITVTCSTAHSAACRFIVLHYRATHSATLHETLRFITKLHYSTLHNQAWQYLCTYEYPHLQMQTDSYILHTSRYIPACKHVQACTASLQYDAVRCIGLRHVT